MRSALRAAALAPAPLGASYRMSKLRNSSNLEQAAVTHWDKEMSQAL
ncbi:MAG: hypothetical protein KME49_25400 [Brasilonema octagenarum HA4186-MV1]|nr:hypothetical protein [Brasilonema octagenarum HA4186-MV1]